MPPIIPLSGTEALTALGWGKEDKVTLGELDLAYHMMRRNYSHLSQMA